MYLYIGGDIILPFSEIVAIISYKGEKDSSKKNQQFLKKEKITQYVDITKDNINSMIVTINDKVYLSSITATTLLTRSKKIWASGRKEKN